MKETKKIENSEDGWTFIETMITIAIILILSATVGYSIIKYVDKARCATARTQIDSFCVALETYYVDCGNYPTQEQGLNSLWTKPTIEPVPKNWDGPYLYKAIPSDPWGNPYDYEVPGYGGLPYGIRSFGSDGYEGGEGNDADITSW